MNKKSLPFIFLLLVLLAGCAGSRQASNLPFSGNHKNKTIKNLTQQQYRHLQMGGTLKHR